MMETMLGNSKKSGVFCCPVYPKPRNNCVAIKLQQPSQNDYYHLLLYLIDPTTIQKTAQRDGIISSKKCFFIEPCRNYIRPHNLNNGGGAGYRPRVHRTYFKRQFIAIATKKQQSYCSITLMVTQGMELDSGLPTSSPLTLLPIGTCCTYV